MFAQPSFYIHDSRVNVCEGKLKNHFAFLRHKLFLEKCFLHKYTLFVTCQVLPAAHFAVHDGRRVKVSQQVIHQVVVMVVFLYYAVISGHVGAQRVRH